MIRSLPNSPFYRIAYGAYVFLFFTFLVMPLLAISVLAFNDSDFISLPWNGFTLDWFFSATDERQGLFADEELASPCPTDYLPENTIVFIAAPWDGKRSLQFTCDSRLSK